MPDLACCFCPCAGVLQFDGAASCRHGFRITANDGSSIGFYADASCGVCRHDRRQTGLRHLLRRLSQRQRRDGAGARCAAHAGRDRISTALSKDGLMAVQSGMLNEQQRSHVIAFLRRRGEQRRQLAGADLSTDPTGRNARPTSKASLSGPPHPRRARRRRRAASAGLGRAKSRRWSVRVRILGTAQSESLGRHARADYAARDRVPADRRDPDRGTRRQLRIVRNGKLDPNPIAGTPKVAVLGTATGFMDIKLHPNFASNGLIYLSYHKPAPASMATTPSSAGAGTARRSSTARTSSSRTMSMRSTPR